ncbi:prolyl oligopeptidase family serine peptidase [Aquamicrobium sp. LC103]|uniref:prolyl oligopeptidase family serine peptidase n=1 Tax=Aquamicrobium sp. LC103 TaxID=1120658 RepID=UPI00063E6F06|nr:prolyl oligopeptidase family serine peptidase [Aquamicrobium sp. LC103]TKT69779.1 alpha/beta hydrolase [Aquamicrobium sp. LC103]
MLRLLRWFLVWLAIPGASHGASEDDPRLGPFEKPRPRELVTVRGQQTFNAYEALYGSFSSRAQCAEVPNALWIEVDGKGDCIRFYAEGLNDDRNAEVLVYFGGDVILRTSKGVRLVSPGYFRQSPDGIHTDMAQWSRQARMPAIYLARPGTHGSSGDHNQRRYRREVALMDQALEMIKSRYGISSFILTGQSGGGHMVASLLNRRSDITAAVISSGLVSVKRVMNYWDRRRTIPGWLLYDASEFYDPADEVSKIRSAPAPGIYVISDPEDHVVPFLSQLHYVRRLRRAGFEPQHIYAHATDRKRHALARHARLAAALIARGEDMKSIRRALDELDLEGME